MTIINGNKFSEISHYSLDYHLNRWDLNTELLENNAIIFCKTCYLHKLFKYIEFSNQKYILITHDSDTSINKKIFEKHPKSIIKWFAVNINYTHDKLINIPLGIENEIVRHKPKPRVNYEFLRNNLERLRNKPKIHNVIYCNWTDKTNPARKNILTTIKNNNIKIIQETNLTQYQYYENISNYKYILCPRGNGIDTHRLWETLCVGSIPVTIDHIIYKNYELPIIKLLKWEDLNLNLLNNYNLSYNYFWLDMENWKTFILKEFKKL